MNEMRKLMETIAQYDAWSAESNQVDQMAEDLINDTIRRCKGDNVDPATIINKIRTGWTGLNPAVVFRAIEILRKESDTTPVEEEQKNYRGMTMHPMDQYGNWSMEDEEILAMRPYYDRVIAAGADPKDVEELMSFAWSAGNWAAGDEL